MTSIRTSLLRPFAGLLRGLLLTGLLIGLWAGVVSLTEIGTAKPRILLRRAVKTNVFAVPAAIAGIIGLWTVLAAFGASRVRLAPGATELTVRRGWLWQSAESVPYAAIDAIQTATGPLGRLQDAADLQIRLNRAPYAVSLPGVKDAKEVVDFLLARRDSLRELRAGEGPQDMQGVLERLASAVERLEQKMEG